ncbi:MaoC/PaaZ C-terminal domain-containing protein [Lysinibacillus sp. 54212]|uniref:MaoC/PaaZ C-terminal domain-containing protein n=1 Tax=Lysinibacillus sp. 54212 TaxID=3119829 RepID=UPI002FC58BFA
MSVTDQFIHAIEFEGLEVNQTLPSYTKPPITKIGLVKYAGASGDFNPLHTDDEFAQKIGMKGVIAHGMLIMGFLGEYVMKLAGDLAGVKQFSMRFGAMTFPGDTITCWAKIKEIQGCEVQLELTAKKQDETIVGSGKAILCYT